MTKNILFTVIIGMMIVSCNYRKQKYGDAIAPQGEVDCTPVSFAKVSTEIFGTGAGNPGRCLGCHNSGFDMSGMGIVLDDYASTFAISNQVNSAIQSGSMPKGAPLNGALKKLVQTWVDQGAPEFDELAVLDPSCPPVDPVQPVDPVEPVDPVIPVDPVVGVTPDFESINASIFSKRCNNCHQSGKNKFEFTTHGRLVETSMKLFAGSTAEDSIFVKALLPGATRPMPPKGPALMDEEIKVIIDWIRAGMPEKKSAAPVVVN